MYIKMNRWVDRHAAEQTRGEQTGIQTRGRTNRQRDRHVNRQVGEQASGRTNRWAGRWADGRAIRHPCGQTGGANRRPGIQVDSQMYRQTDDRAYR